LGRLNAELQVLRFAQDDIIRKGDIIRMDDPATIGD